MKRFLSVTTFGLLLFLLGFRNKEEVRLSDYYSQIKNGDLSRVMNADSFWAEDHEGGKEWIRKPEILGFIGEDFQRFSIHITSVAKNSEKPYEYTVVGKTKVNKSICSFRGFVKVKKASTFISTYFPKRTQGTATCEVLLFEEKSQSNSGVIKGELVCNFWLNTNGTLEYNGLSYNSDDFSNNQFVGTWTSYKTNLSKKCNWGDFRIPESGDLDIGAGEFSVNDKYLKNGWVNYSLAYGCTVNDSIRNAARKLEAQQWWK